MDKVRALQYFVAAADARSFAGAARRLDVSVSMVHKSVTALETHLGSRLFERHNRGLALTSVGAAYLDAARPLLSALDELDLRAQQSGAGLSGAVVVGAAPQLAHRFLGPALPRFAAAFPGVEIDLRVVQRVTEVDAEGVDVFLLHGWPEAQDLVHRTLGHARTVVAATPEYWSRNGRPKHPSELAAHGCLLMRNPAGALLDLWVFESGSDRAEVKVRGWFCSNDREMVLANVLAHHGVGRFNVLTTREHLRSGRLVTVLDDWEVLGGPPLNLLYRSNVRRAPLVRQFVDFLMELLAEYEAEEGAAAQRIPVARPIWHGLRHGRASTALRTRR